MPLNSPGLSPPATSKLEMRPVFSHISKSCRMVTVRLASIRGDQNASRTLTSVKGTGVSFCSANVEKEQRRRQVRVVSFPKCIGLSSEGNERVLLPVIPAAQHVLGVGRVEQAVFDDLLFRDGAAVEERADGVEGLGRQA